MTYEKFLRYEPLIKIAENIPLPPKNIIDEAFKIAYEFQHHENQEHLEEDSYEYLKNRDNNTFYPPLDNESNQNIHSFVKEEVDRMENYDWSKSLGLPINTVESYTDDCAYFKYLDANEIIHEWVKENIPYIIHSSGVNIIYGGKKLLPHKDFAKNQLNMVIECNEETMNYLYEPKKEFKHLDVNSYSFIPYEKLDVVQEIKIEKNKWYYFPSTRIHSIENINNTRRVLISLLIDNNYII